MNREVLKVENIEKYYGKRGNITKAIDNISFAVENGEFNFVYEGSSRWAAGKWEFWDCPYLQE